MEYRRFESKLIVRLDPGDEVLASLAEVCSKEDVALGIVSGIGAVNKVRVGLFNPLTKEYFASTLERDFEITALIGSVSRMNGEVYLHLHATLADIEHKAFGGHLNAATVSATAEIWIDVVKGAVDRSLSQSVGLNLLKFD